MSEIVVKDFLESGVHFGHRASRWNPKMRPYIYARRNQIHIIDLKETLRGLIRAKKYLARVVSQGSLVLFVGTKRQAAEAVACMTWSLSDSEVAELDRASSACPIQATQNPFSVP